MICAVGQANTMCNRAGGGDRGIGLARVRGLMWGLKEGPTWMECTGRLRLGLTFKNSIVF